MRARGCGTMHVATAVRYVADAFVTHDPRILAAAERIQSAYSSLRVLSPQAALLWLGVEVRLHRIRWLREDWKPPLPDWPDDDEITSWAQSAGTA
jgi:hypothetical protein